MELSGLVAAALSLTSSLAGASVPPLVEGGAGWLAVAFGLGLLHALDADHVMALSLYATREDGAAAGARAGLRWSAGHGVVVLVAGLVLAVLGRAIPDFLVALAERSVGLVMIGLGLVVLVGLVRRRAHLHFHVHDAHPPHAHWHAHAERATPALAHQHDHGPVFVGALHGLAGSAPILAVLPIASHSPWLAGFHLVLFGTGVALAMVVVSGLLGHAAGRLSLAGAGRGLACLRACGAGGSMAIGAWLAFAA